MQGSDEKMKMGYGRFAAMIATSTVVMFGLMYLNTYALSHVFYSQTRTWMAIYMGAVMAIIMLGFMWSMYPNKRANLAIMAGSVVVFAGALYLVRSQETVDDVSWMKAMIPHHSIAINNARKADIRDPRVRYLADRIIRDQVKEITEMKMLLADIDKDGREGNVPLAARPTALKPEGAQEAKELLSGKLLRDEPL